MINEKGQAAILIVFVLGMISILISLSLTETGFKESIMGRTDVASAKAFYVANSGVEEAFAQIGRNPDYQGAGTQNFALVVGEGQAQVTVSGTEDQKTIKSVGTNGAFVRKLNVEIQNTSLKPGFDHAIHAGQGGFELNQNSIITGYDYINNERVDGNVFSNRSVLGDSTAHDDDGCKGKLTGSGHSPGSSSWIFGSVWAVENIDRLTENPNSGMCISGEAHANQLKYCFVEGNRVSLNTPEEGCSDPGSGPYVPVPPPYPTPHPLPEMGVANLKDYLLGRGKVFSGDCILDGSGGPSDCSEGTNIIGNMIIAGNLRKPSNVNIKISGPVWVQKNVIFDSLGSVGLTADITEVSQIMVVDGTILSDSNVVFGSNEAAFLLFISTYAPESTPPPEPESAEFCEPPAIRLSSNTNSVLFYATNGCVVVTPNSTFHGAILGEKIVVDNNSTVEYDPALQSAIFGLTKSGGWQVISFKEE